MALPQLASDWRRLTPPPKIGGGRRAACDCSAGSQVVLQRMQHGALAPPPTGLGRVCACGGVPYKSPAQACWARARPQPAGRRAPLLGRFGIGAVPLLNLLHKTVDAPVSLYFRSSGVAFQRQLFNI